MKNPFQTWRFKIEVVFGAALVAGAIWFAWFVVVRMNMELDLKGKITTFLLPAVVGGLGIYFIRHGARMIRYSAERVAAYRILGQNSPSVTGGIVTLESGGRSGLTLKSLTLDGFGELKANLLAHHGQFEERKRVPLQEIARTFKVYVLPGRRYPFLVVSKEFHAWIDDA